MVGVQSTLGGKVTREREKEEEDYEEKDVTSSFFAANFQLNTLFAFVLGASLNSLFFETVISRFKKFWTLEGSHGKRQVLQPELT